jgi:hypothetical protein
MYILRLVFRRIMNRITITTKDTKAGTRVVTNPDAEGDAVDGSSWFPVSKQASAFATKHTYRASHQPVNTDVGHSEGLEVRQV